MAINLTKIKLINFRILIKIYIVYVHHLKHSNFQTTLIEQTFLCLTNKYEIETTLL